MYVTSVIVLLRPEHPKKLSNIIVPRTKRWIKYYSALAAMALFEECSASQSPGLGTDTQRSMLTQRIMGIAQGYEDLNDHQTLREDRHRSINEDGPCP